ncbi:MAG: DUF3078 domain-containing protein [Chlorobi bacterium]|nr:DUF3078 domain-containing protein [Chlorobiota bacterium]
MRFKYCFLIFLFTLFLNPLFSKTLSKKKKVDTTEIDSIQANIDYLKQYFITNGSWHTSNPEIRRNVEGLIHFIQDQPLDSIIRNIALYHQDSAMNYVTRLPGNVSDTLAIEGFVPAAELDSSLKQIEISVLSDYKGKEIMVPIELIRRVEYEAGTIPPGKGMELFKDSIYIMPDSLKFLDAIPDSLIRTVKDFQRIVKLDSIRNSYVENHRKAYNDSIVKAYRDSVILAYRQNFIRDVINSKKKWLSDSVKLNNFELVKSYNDSIIHQVNDSIANVLMSLARYANSIDTMQIWFKNLKNESSGILLSNNQQYTRIWLKNAQNDSLSVLIKTMGKDTMQMLLDDGITFTRFTQRESRKVKFDGFKPDYKLDEIREKYKVETPWRLAGNGNFGFTQTYLENWKKGGQSAISLLTVLKGSAIYTNKKFKWENNVEIRNGWIQSGGVGEGIRKTDDKLEIISRVGLSAFKKWYYSAELDFETQFFRGYKYPDLTTPISEFLSPARTLFKIGMDYKPNKKFSVFISPFTAKHISVRDTANIDQTKFGIAKGEKRFWEPGLNADIKLRIDISPDIRYETKYKMFINYIEPFKKRDINWENQITMQLTNRINMQMMLHLLYDDNVLFSETRVINGVEEVVRVPKLQVKELITIGFSYKINKKVYKTRTLM